MASEAFQVGEDASRYDFVADGVEKHGHLLRPLVQRLIAVAALRPGERLLDLGCGTGAIANRAARRIGPRGSVVGLDISAGMLERALAEAVREGIASWVDYRLGDAEAPPFVDGSFDVVTCLYTFMHLPHPQRAASEIYRVLAPGGRVVVGVGGAAPGSLRGWLHRAARMLDRIDVWRGRALLCPELLDSLVRAHLGVEHRVRRPAAWSDPVGRLTRLLAAAGFCRIESDWEACLTSFPDPEEFWEVQTTYSSFARQRLVEAQPSRVEAIRADFLARCEEVLARGGRLLYPIGVVCVSGRKPASPS